MRDNTHAPPRGGARNAKRAAGRRIGAFVESPDEILTLAGRLAAIDPELAIHGRLVGIYASRTADELGLPKATARRLGLAGELHDIGKLAMPKQLLEKPGPLTEPEWMHIRTHPVVGANLIRAAGLDEIADWVYAHHERPDGSGYPCAIPAAQIPLESTILAVADAYHAMTTDRPYQGAISRPAALTELRRGAGTQFDLVAVDSFLPALKRTMPFGSRL